MLKKIVIFAFKLLVVVGLFYFVFVSQGISTQSLWTELKKINLASALPWLAFAAAIKLAGIFAGIVRWRILLRAQGVHIPFWYLTKCWFWGRAIGLFLPGTLGLDGYRLIESSRYTGEVIKCTTVIAVEKLTGIIALFSLVFLTVPLGMRLFEFNIVLLAAVLFILACFIIIFLTLLLKPRIIQIVVAVLPTPVAVRDKVNKIGDAVTTYGDKKASLFAALFFGFLVHVAICLMYFGTMSALRTEGVDIWDILFASPLIIVASVLTPTVSGMGVREVIMTSLLAASAGTDKAFLFGHLGLWFGEIVPFLLSLPLLLFTGRPNRDTLMDEAEAVRRAAKSEKPHLSLRPQELATYRIRIFSCLGAGIAAGLLGGTFVGWIEGLWHIHTLANPTELAVYWWAPLLYGLTLFPIGIGVVAVLLFLYLLFDRFAPTAFSFGLSLAGTLFVPCLIFGLFRYRRDILMEQPFTQPDLIKVFAFATGIALAGFILGTVLIAVARAVLPRALRSGVATSFATLLLFVISVSVGVVLANTKQPHIAAPTFQPIPGAMGPNVILIVVDTLRADYLKAYNPEAVAVTPNLDAFFNDTVLFETCIAQSSWTKASFGTIFSGLYPETHTAIGKISALPDEIVTFPEALLESGYYTKGFSNNPNIESAFNYGQGFVDYVDLKPDLYLGATASCKKLTLYDILRQVIQRIYGKLGGIINIKNFYQPAEQVTAVGLSWLDDGTRAVDAPFFLFLHYMDPHDPFRDPKRPGKGYARAQMKDPDPAKYLEAFKRSYNYEIEYLDEHLGTLIAGLRERGLYDDALIILTADHGEEFHEHGGWWHGLSLYDEQIAVPLAFKLPANAEASTRVSGIARHVDLAPTLLYLVGAQSPSAMQGQPLLDLVYNPVPAGKSAYSHLNFEGIELRAVRDLNYKIIEANEGNKRDYPPVSFFDVKADPGEQDNLAEDAAKQAIIEAFTRGLERMRGMAAEDAAQAATGNLEQMDRSQLEDIGYLGGDESITDDTEPSGEDTSSNSHPLPEQNHEAAPNPEFF